MVTEPGPHASFRAANPADVRARCLWLWVLGVAVGYFEAAVVVYLRELYYPAGFHFPVVLASQRVALVEISRELASIVLLAAAGRLAGRFFIERFAAFMILFGVWDLFYYVFLRLILEWPAGFGTWDVLFLLPVPWLGPVWAPLLVSVALAAAGTWIFCTPERPRRITSLDWSVQIAAGLLVVASMTADWRAVPEGRVPQAFPSWLYWTGFLLALAWFARIEWRATRPHPALECVRGSGDRPAGSGRPVGTSGL